MVDKTTVLDGCVDGDETCFGNLVGKDYDEFNLIYGIVKQNAEVLDPEAIRCNYSDQNDQLCVSIPLKEKVDLTDLELPQDKAMDTKIDGNSLVITITVKEEW